MKKKILLIILACLYFHFSFNQGIDELINNFQSNDWNTVLTAKNSLENLDSKSIPKLIGLLDDNAIIKLKNTGDLIYPGAEKFFGYGLIIDYDIDKISIRAGWLLEELTFQNFGFSGVHIQESRLINYLKFNFPEYYNNSVNRKKFESCRVDEKRAIILKLSHEKVTKWWEKEAGSWKRLNALIDALYSTDEKRQVKALFYLRNGKTKCPGLTESAYESKIKGRIIELSKVELKRVSEHAKLILLDQDFEWLEMKQD